MIKLQVILFTGLILGWTFAEYTTEIDLETVTEVPEREIQIQANESSTAKPIVKRLHNNGNLTQKSLEEIFRIAQRENENEVIESLSPGDFIFNSCELRKYKTSNEFLQKFPYYLSGFDGENRPIWVAELGKFDLNSVIAGKSSQAFEDFAKDVVYNFIKSLFIKPGPGRPTFDFIFIIDFEGFTKEQITVQNVLLVLKLARLYTRLLEEYAYSVVIINVNEHAESLGPLVKPYAEDVLEKVTIFGRNKKEWMAHLRKTIPVDQLPAFYGGQDPNYKPLRVF